MKPTLSPRTEPPFPGWVPTRTTAKVPIPTADGGGIAEIIKVEVDAWRDPETNEVYLDNDTTDQLDRVKARHLGILAPEELKALRQALELSQKELSALLQIGEKSWTRWETGRERPSRSMNVLLRALKDGRIDAGYLRSLRSSQPLTVTEYAHAPQPGPAMMVCEPATPAAFAKPVSAPRKPAARARPTKSRD